MLKVQRIKEVFSHFLFQNLKNKQKNVEFLIEL